MASYDPPFEPLLAPEDEVVDVDAAAIGAAFEDIVWVKILSVAGVAAVLSLLMSLAGLPEVGSDGTLVVDTKNPTKDVYSLELDKPLEALPNKKVVKFKVQK